LFLCIPIDNKNYIKINIYYFIINIFNYLQFVDDSLLTGVKSWANVRALKVVLLLFEFLYLSLPIGGDPRGYEL